MSSDYERKMEVWRNRDADFATRISSMRPEVYRYRSMGTVFLRAVISQFVNPLELHPTCITCRSFDKQVELCNKATPPARPPATVIAMGCGAYDDEDEIPF